MANNNYMNKNEISIYYQNCRGIRTKLNTIYMNILSNCFDVITLTETWLTPSIFDSKFIDSRYVVFRCDRNRAATDKSDGEGVLIAVLRELSPVCVSLSQHNTWDWSKFYEHIIVTIPSSNNMKQYLVSAVYFLATHRVLHTKYTSKY